MGTSDPDFSDQKNWDFEGIKEESELRACLQWEYARQSPFMRDLDRHWNTQAISALTNQERQRLFIFTGSVFSAFPEKAWRELTHQERATALRHLLRVQVFSHSALASLEREVARIGDESRKEAIDGVGCARRSLGKHLFIESGHLEAERGHLGWDLDDNPRLAPG